MKSEAAAKLVAGPVGSIWKLTQRWKRARSVCGSVHATLWFTSFIQRCDGYIAIGNRKSKMKGGEDRNRTYPVPPSGTTTVLKTARATRHPSLSHKKKTSNVQRPISNAELSELDVER